MRVHVQVHGSFTESVAQSQAPAHSSTSSGEDVDSPTSYCMGIDSCSRYRGRRCYNILISCAGASALQPLSPFLGPCSKSTQTHIMLISASILVLPATLKRAAMVTHSDPLNSALAVRLLVSSDCTAVDTPYAINNDCAITATDAECEIISSVLRITCLSSHTLFCLTATLSSLL